MRTQSFYDRNFYRLLAAHTALVVTLLGSAMVMTQ